MALVKCVDCQNDVSKDAQNCPNCGAKISWINSKKQFSNITTLAENSEQLQFKSGLSKTLKWFALVNVAVIVSLSITTMGQGTSLAPILLLMGAIFPVCSLFASKYLAKKTHAMRTIKEDSEIESERQLYELVKALSKKAGIENTPEVAVYSSEEMNAFATGAQKNDSLIAFSDALLKKMDEQEIAAVAAHEIAHIANGDMVTLTVVQSVINAVILLISIPLSLLKIGAFFNKDVGLMGYALIAFIKAFVVTVMMFLGNLVVKFFSRKREFEADKLASELLDKNSMIKALESLSQETSSIQYSKEVESYAALKINSPLSGIADVFSTHPSIERRIAALSSNETNSESTAA